MRRLLLLFAALATLTSQVGVTPVAAQAPPGCQTSGSLRGYLPTLEDFGASTAYVVRDDPSYWSGRGHSFGFRRFDWSDAMSNPYGAFMTGGVVRATNPAVASNDLADAVKGWVGDGSFERVDVPQIGDEIVVYRRLTPWEADKETPMVEVFVGVRRCNVNAHFLLAVMPEFDPLVQALRYARIVDQRLGG